MKCTKPVSKTNHLYLSVTFRGLQYLESTQESQRKTTGAQVAGAV